MILFRVGPNLGARFNGQSALLRLVSARSCISRLCTKGGSFRESPSGDCNKEDYKTEKMTVFGGLAGGCQCSFLCIVMLSRNGVPSSLFTRKMSRRLDGLTMGWVEVSIWSICIRHRSFRAACACIVPGQYAVNIVTHFTSSIHSLMNPAQRISFPSSTP